jgi:hypothetical protein
MDRSACGDLRQALSRRGFLQVGPAALLTAGLVHALARRSGAARAQVQDLQGQLRYVCDGNPVRELF